MAFQLKIDEMLDALTNDGHPRSAELTRLVEATADILAAAICDKYDIVTGGASFQGEAFAGTCVPFYAKYEGQELPQEIAPYDDENEWCVDPDFIDPAECNPFHPESPEGRAFERGDIDATGTAGDRTDG